MAAPVIIRVGCGLDTSVESTFGSIERRAQQAGKRVEKAMGPQGGRRSTAGYDAVGAAERRTSRQREQDAKNAARAQAQAERQATRAASQSSRERLRIFRAEMRQRLADNARWVREAKAEEREHTRAVAAEAKKREKALRAADREQAKRARASARELDRFATRTSHRATRFLWPNAPLASMARRGLGDILRGVGIDTSISGAVGRARDMESSAYFLSSKGYRMGESGPAGTRVDPKTLIDEARKLGTEQAFDPQDIMEAQKAYVGLTGDLATARSLMGDIAKLSGATGSSMEDLMRTAGAMGNAMGDGFGDANQKAEYMLTTMRLLAGQGKLTAIEMDTLAPAMPKIVGAARQYGQDVTKTIGQMGALAQLSMGGGAWNASSAATALAGFTAEMQGAKADRNAKKIGLQLRDTKGMLRGPFDIIRDALRLTGGDSTKLSKLFTGTRGGRVVNALSAEYRKAGGGEAGMAAVDKFLAPLMKAGMTREQIEEINAKRMETAAAKAQKFQNQLDLIVETAAGKVIPALEQLAPKALEVAKGLGDLVGWLASNPGKAVGLAIAASIARAGLESTFRAALERAIVGAAGVGGGGAKGGFMPAGGALGAASAAMTIMATAVTLYAMGQISLDALFNASDKAEQRSRGEAVATSTRLDTAERQAREQGGLSPEQAKALEEERASLQKKISEAGQAATAKDFLGGPLTMLPLMMRLARGAVGAEGGTTVEREFKKHEDAVRIDELRAQMERIAMILAGGINVNNIADARTPKSGSVDPSGREPT